jgi:glutathione S-transferase
MTGAHMAPGFKAINPNCAVPCLVDGELNISECSAILKYLAELSGSPAYPMGDIKVRARINQRMDWFNTGLYRDLGYGVIYTQTMPHLKHEDPGTQADVIAKSTQGAHKWLDVLEGYLGSHAYVCGDTYTIADPMGAAYLSIADWVKFDLGKWPNTTRWLNAQKARPSWAKVNDAWNGVTQYFQSQLGGAAA